MRRYTIEIGGKPYTLAVDEVATDRYTVSLDDGESYDVQFVSEDGPAPAAASAPLAPAARVAPPPSSSPAARSVATPAGRVSALKAPLPGAIVSVAVKAGDTVTRGQVLVTMETMKMQNPLRSPRDGIVEEICVQAGQTVAHNDLLVRFRDA